MPDVTTTCPDCGQAFETKRGLRTHMTIQGHGGGSGYTSVLEELSAARPIPCTFPGCSSSFRSKLGLKIHTTLLGHQSPADKLAKGDGPESVPRVHRGPRDGPEEPVDAAFRAVQAVVTRLKLEKPATFAMMPTDRADPGCLAQALDATIDAALDAFAAGSVPQAQALIMAADTVVDQLLDSLGVPDADEDVQDGQIMDMGDTGGYTPDAQAV